MLPVHVAREVSANLIMGVPALRRLRNRGKRTSAATVEAQAKQMRDQFAFFMGTLGDVRGKTIAEIGPGDAIALGAMFLQAGAARYVAYDRFRGDVFGTAARELYACLGVSPDEDRVDLCGAIEDINPRVEGQVDAVISFDVLEHVMDPALAIRQMAAILKPDGVMVHRVDYSPHDVWRSYPNAFTFLGFPDWLWNAMGSNRGYPNRARHVQLMRSLDLLGFKIEERITRHFQPDQLKALRGKLRRFRKFTDDQMLVLLAEFTACRKRKAPLGPAFPY